MTTSILLIRHAAHSQLGNVLSGRVGEVALSHTGVAQARRLGERLAPETLDEIHASPILRARDTAQAIATGRGIAVHTAEPLNEVDFGAWAGMAFADLESDPQWRRWNEQRGQAATPGGETMIAVQDRVLGYMRDVARRAADKVVAMVSHCDVIRAAVAGVLGLSLDRLLQFDIDPASVSRIELGAWGERLVTLNERGH